MKKTDDTSTTSAATSVTTAPGTATYPNYGESSEHVDGNSQGILIQYSIKYIHLSLYCP